MKTIKLQVIIEVSDNYQIDEPIWTLEDALLKSSPDMKINDVKILHQGYLENLINYFKKKIKEQ